MSDWKSSPVKRLQAAAISIIGYRLCAALGSTLKWRVEGVQHYDAVVLGGHQPIMAFWHGRILPSTIYFRNRGIVVITSENFDGEWIAGIIERFGYGTARGSTSRGGRKALIQMKRDMAAGKPTAFTLDGPRGPARVAQAGAVWLSKTARVFGYGTLKPTMLLTRRPASEPIRPVIVSGLAFNARNADVSVVCRR